MDNRHFAKRRMFAFITPENVDGHIKEIEAALHLPNDDIAILFGDMCINDYRKNLDKVMDDCVNITKKYLENAIRFHVAGSEDVESYFQRACHDIDVQVQESLTQLRAKHAELIHVYEDCINTARKELKHASGYNEAILIKDFKKNIILAIQNSSCVPEPHAIDKCADYDLDSFQKKIIEILKSTKHHKKEVVHDIKKQLERLDKNCREMLGKNTPLIFRDKHTVYFTPTAYKLETSAISAKTRAREILKQVHLKAETSIRGFEKEAFFQDHFQRISHSSTHSMHSLQQFRQLSQAKSRITELLVKDIDAIDEFLAVTDSNNIAEVQLCARMRDQLITLNVELSNQIQSVLTKQSSIEEADIKFQKIVAKRHEIRMEMQSFAKAAASSTVAVYKKIGV